MNKMKFLPLPNWLFMFIVFVCLTQIHVLLQPTAFSLVKSSRFSWLFDCFFIRSIVTMPKCVYWQENGPSEHLHQCNSFPDKPDLGRCNPGYISPSGVNLSRVNFSRVHLARVHHVRVHLVRVHLVRVNLIWSCLLSIQSFHTWHCTMYGSVH